MGRKTTCEKYSKAISHINLQVYGKSCVSHWPHIKVVNIIFEIDFLQLSVYENWHNVVLIINRKEGWEQSFERKWATERIECIWTCLTSLDVPSLPDAVSAPTSGSATLLELELLFVNTSLIKVHLIFIVSAIFCQMLKPKPCHKEYHFTWVLSVRLNTICNVKARGYLVGARRADTPLQYLGF